MKLIPLTPLTSNKFALVDDDDFAYLTQWKWECNAFGYALRRTYSKKKLTIIWMHREINKTPKGFVTDHINRNKLDNRKINLRTSTKSENALNTGLCKTNPSGHKGVWFGNHSGKWHAEIRVEQKKKFLGSFITYEDAVEARQAAERLYL